MSPGAVGVFPVTPVALRGYEELRKLKQYVPFFRSVVPSYRGPHLTQTKLTLLREENAYF